MRITGGVLRSRALVAPRGQETRPTSDRVREALFSMLVSDGVFDVEPGPRVLDLYAGSGALAFEALSRGAREAVLVESARPAALAIRDNAAALDLVAQVTVLTRPCERAIDEVRGPFDLVLVDPPYAGVRAKGFSDLLARAAKHLVPGGVLVLEHDAKDEPAPPEGLSLDRRRRHGDTVLSLFRRT
ncbi:MAG: 16S rRNA (guanine(966)-N(2))-methyltransferase RsmD [Labilithrix sp.]|nr:16S rRNA (guanine(966)-N(2))-methyltransferase RsmD [Labilithrix sp.]MCW5810689.1 16S rRNA (guanine(966)-N(2))-methyltransferase RsmD [Labilithrix sp.]